MVHPKRFELLTPWFVAKYSIQLSYGCGTGGERGIRTLDASFSSHAPLAGECLRPLGHFSKLLLLLRDVYYTCTDKLCQIIFMKNMK